MLFMDSRIIPILSLSLLINLLRRKGWCDFGRTKYADGILPIDTYKNDVDEICTQELVHDWEGLRASINELDSDSGTQHCPHKCHREQFRCVKCNQWNRTT